MTENIRNLRSQINSKKQDYNALLKVRKSPYISESKAKDVDAYLEDIGAQIDKLSNQEREEYGKYELATRYYYRPVVRRKSPARRKSPKRKSPKRKSPKRKSPKRKSPARRRY